MTRCHCYFAGSPLLRWFYGSGPLSALTTFHQSYIAGLGFPEFLGIRKVGGVVLWLHEGDTPAFEVIYISDTPMRGRRGVVACPIPPVPLPTNLAGGSKTKCSARSILTRR